LRIAPLLLSLCFATLSAWAATQWKTDPAQSTVKFTATQAGAEFTGTFQKFTANIQFDAKDLATSHFDVVIDLKSTATQDKERDDTLQGDDLFAVKRWPTAHYVASHFTAQSNGSFVADGKLTLRDVTKDVPIEFTFQPDANGGLLKGTAKIKRLMFGVGQGEWKETTWVGDDVKVQFSLRLQK
jgi:polyisoprenoid-binding protein YceI